MSRRLQECIIDAERTLVLEQATGGESCDDCSEDLEHGDPFYIVHEPGLRGPDYGYCVPCAEKRGRS